MSAFADEYSTNFKEQVEKLHEENIPYIEPRLINGKPLTELSVEEVKEAKKLLDLNQVQISAIGSPIGKIDILGDIESHFKDAEKIFQYANILGAKRIRMFSFYNYSKIDKKEFENKVFEYMDRLLNLADSYGLMLCHENEAEIYGEGYENCYKLLTHFKGRLRAVYDMANFVVKGYDTVKAYLMLKDYIEYFHIKDALYEDVIVPARYGEGRVQEIITMAVKDLNRDFITTVEPHLQVFNGLGYLAAKNSTIKNKYRYPSQKDAFMAAINATREMIKSVEEKEIDVHCENGYLIKKYHNEELLIKDVARESSLFIATALTKKEKARVYFDADPRILTAMKHSGEFDLDKVEFSNNLVESDVCVSSHKKEMKTNHLYVTDLPNKTILIKLL